MKLLPTGFFVPPTGGGSSGGTLLLDTLTATFRAAYEPNRRVRSGYSGALIRVRRSSDNTEQNIIASNDLLDIATMLAFCGSGDGFVTTLYDQSINGQHLVQSNPAKQPQIVASGAVLKYSNTAAKPALKFLASNSTCISCAAFNIGAVSAFSAFFVAQRTGNSGRIAAYEATGDNNDYGSVTSTLIAFRDGNNIKAVRAGTDLGSVASTTAAFSGSSSWNGVNHVMTIDGTASSAVASTGFLGASGALYYGGTSHNESWDGSMGPLLIATGTVTSGDQAAIMTDFKNYYGTP